ncbi:uncharacterized protein LOC143287382 isoform X2 [Babylonia areolata]
MNSIFACITPFNVRFFDAIGTSDSCNRSRITSQVCGWFGEIVTCVKGTNASRVTCLVPGVTAQINPNMGIPCKVEDFVAVCPAGASIWNFDLTNTTTTAATTTTTTTDATGRGGNGFTPFLWMVLVMACLAVLLAVG